MENRQLKSGDRIKMKLVQPAIKCSGRKDVVCHYRGRVIETYNQFAFIQFTKHHQEVVGCYDAFKECFIDDDYKDIKLM